MPPKERKTQPTTDATQAADKKTKVTETYGLLLQSSRVATNIRNVTKDTAVFENETRGKHLTQQHVKAEEALKALPADAALAAEASRLKEELAANRKLHKELTKDTLRVGKPTPYVFTLLHERIIENVLTFTLRSCDPGMQSVTVKSCFPGSSQADYPYLAFVSSLPEFRYDLAREQELERVRLLQNTKRAELQKTITKELDAVRETNKALPEAELAVLVKARRAELHKTHQVEDNESDDDDENDSFATRFDTYIKKIQEKLVKQGTVPKFTITPRYYSFLSEVIVASIHRITNAIINNFIKGSFNVQPVADKDVHPKTINYSHVMQYVLTVMSHENFPADVVAAFKTDCDNIVLKTQEKVENSKKAKVASLSADEVAKVATEKVASDEKKRLAKVEKLRRQLAEAEATPVAVPVAAATA